MVTLILRVRPEGDPNKAVKARKQLIGYITWCQTRLVYSGVLDLDQLHTVQHNTRKHINTHRIAWQNCCWMLKWFVTWGKTQTVVKKGYVGREKKKA